MKIEPYIRKANFYETDGMSIIYHGNYVHWMEEARVDMLEQMGFDYATAVEQGIDFGVASISCRYKSMTRYGDTVKIIVSVEKISPAKLTMGYQIVDFKTEELRFEGESEHFFFDRNKGRPVALKKVLPEVYGLFQRVFEGNG